MTTATLEAEEVVKVRLLTHFRGRMTNEDYYTAGAVIQVALADAERLIGEHKAELAPDDAALSEPAEYSWRRPPPTPPPAPEPEPPPLPEWAAPYLTAEGTRVRFITDHRSAITAEDFYRRGSVAVLPPDGAAALVAKGIVTPAEPDAAIDLPAERGHRERPAAVHPSDSALLVEIRDLLRRLVALLEARPL